MPRKLSQVEVNNRCLQRHALGGGRLVSAAAATHSRNEPLRRGIGTQDFDPFHTHKQDLRQNERKKERDQNGRTEPEVVSKFGPNIVCPLDSQGGGNIFGMFVFDPRVINYDIRGSLLSNLFVQRIG